MGVLHPPESEYAKERVKWEAEGSLMGPGLRPYVYRPYPCWMYKAGRPANGMGPHIIEDAFEVPDEVGERNARSRGYWPTPLEAIAALDVQYVEHAKLAAEIEWEKQHKLSPAAVAEVEAAQAAHSGHMPMVPETPIAPRPRAPRQPRAAAPDHAEAAPIAAPAPPDPMPVAVMEAPVMAQPTPTPASLPEPPKKRRGGWPAGKPRKPKAVAVDDDGL